LSMGPLWDFDLAAGNVNYSDAYLTAGLHVRNGPWFSRLFQDPAFLARVRQVWNGMKADDLPAMYASITANAAKLQQPQLNNFERWPILRDAPSLSVCAMVRDRWEKSLRASRLRARPFRSI